MSEKHVELNLKDNRVGRLPAKLVWLADAPLYIDHDQVARFYDAVVKPNAVQDDVKLTLTKETVRELEGKLGLEVGVTPSELGAALSTVFAFIKPELKATGEGAIATGNRDERSVEVTLREISTPQRQLEQLVLHYLINHPNRLFLDGVGPTRTWTTPAAVSAVPRAVLFLDLPGTWEAKERGLPATKLIPTAVEFENGKIELLFDKFRGKDGAEPPRYPETARSEAELLEQRRSYWQWFDTHFSATTAMITIEKASSEHGRIRWIDYRVPLDNNGDTLHLHVCPGGRFDTGVLAYNFVKRGFTHGLRVVGTLKSGPDLNVLAIYDK